MIVNNGWLNIYKPIGITSAKVVSLIKKKFKLKKIGHAGTLDPLAEGVLPISFGTATRTSSFVLKKIKKYQFTIKWGEQTTTDDMEGKILYKTNNIPKKVEINKIVKKFTGQIDQTPPNFSSIKINGNRAYKLSRKNINFKINSRKVFVYELNYLDGWQVILFFMGMAGTGKSTIITKVIKEFYEKDDVGQLSNDGEKTFGLSAFYNKLLFIAPEVKQDFNLPQASFQSMISGEDVSVALKFKTAENVEWNVPGVLAGNEPPGYVDNAGSMSRRLVVAKFSKKVKKDKLDTQLGKKLQQEIPYILLKSNRAYHEAIKSYGSKDIWPHLPKYFRKQQQSMAEDTNSLTSFLGSGKVVFNSSYYCLEKTFKQELQQYCQENNLKNKSWNSTFYDGPLHDAALRYGTHIEIVRQQRKRYPRPNGDKKHGTFILGLDIMLDQDSDSDDNDEINNL